MLQETVQNDWKQALKSRSPEKDCLSMILTELKNRAIRDNQVSDKGRFVSDDVALEVLQKMAKQRQESISSYQEAGRQDLVEKETLELGVIKKYLPTPLSDAELEKIIKTVMSEQGVSSKKEIGKVMGGVIKLVKGRADGKRIQQKVMSLLD